MRRPAAWATPRRSLHHTGTLLRAPAPRAAAQRRLERAGWTKEEVLALKVALEKFGIGRWVQIVDSGVLPGKLIQQLNGQTQRLLGQQSIAGAARRARRARRNARSLRRRRVRADNSRGGAAAFTGLHVDVDAVRKDNEAKQGEGIMRKSGLIINTGGAQRVVPSRFKGLGGSLGGARG